MLASMLLFWCNPQSTYESRMDGVQDVVMNWVSRLPFVEITADGNLGIVLDDGEVAGVGNHETLLKKKGFYYDLYNSQFAKNV